MRLSLRFLIPLLVALALFAYAAVPLADTLMQRWFVRDLDIRSNLIANTVQEPLEDLIKTGSAGAHPRLLPAADAATSACTRSACACPTDATPDRHRPRSRARSAARRSRRIIDARRPPAAHGEGRAARRRAPDRRRDAGQRRSSCSCTT